MDTQRFRRTAITIIAACLLLFPLGLAAQATLTVSAEPGKSYSVTRTAFLNTIKVNPHLAVWLETADGVFVKTIYVSLKNGQQDFWVGKRPHPLPVWASRGEKLPLPDAVTGASTLPSLPAKLEWKSGLPASGSPFVVRLEVNRAFDFNAGWPVLPQEVWGQPSLLYEAAVPSGGQVAVLELKGRADGQGGQWLPDLGGIDSARDILARTTIRSVSK